MAQIPLLSLVVPIKSSADHFYGFLRNKMQNLVQIFPDNFLSFGFIEGNDFTTSCLMNWSYDIIGAGPGKCKAKIADVDEENKSMTYEVVEGDILSQYSLFRLKFRVSDNEIIGGATVHWSLEFLKANENVPSPQIYMDFVSLVSMKLDAYLIANQPLI